MTFVLHIATYRQCNKTAYAIFKIEPCNAFKEIVPIDVLALIIGCLLFGYLKYPSVVFF